MSSKSEAPEIPLPKRWRTHVKSAVLHVISLAQYALTYSRSWVADSSNERVRLKAENDHLTQEVALLREEMRIKDVRTAQIAPQRKPHHRATERMAILELRATRGWSLEQAATVFLVTAETISSWVRRIDEAGAETLVQTSQPVNKFPDCVQLAPVLAFQLSYGFILPRSSLVQPPISRSLGRPTYLRRSPPPPQRSGTAGVKKSQTLPWRPSWLAFN